MAFTNLTDDVAIISTLSDTPNATEGLSATQLKAKFDEAVGIIKTYLNSTLIAELSSTTDSDSGADNIGVTTITDITGNTIQAVLEDLRNTLKSTTDSDSGADFVNNTAISPFSATTLQSLLEELVTRLQATTDSASGGDLIGTTTVSGLSGNTVQTVLEALKTFTDTHISDTTTHGTTGNIVGTSDSQTLTNKTIDVDSNTVSNIEVDNLKSGVLDTDLSSVSASDNTIPSAKAAKEYVDETVADVVLGQIPDNSLTDIKLAPDNKVGSLATLETDNKSDTVVAINEVHEMAYLTEKLKVNEIKDTKKYSNNNVDGNPVFTYHVDESTNVETVNLVQLVKNGNFEDGTEWAPVGGTESVANNTYTHTCDGTLVKGTVISSPITSLDNTTDEFFAICEARVTNADCDKIVLRAGGSNSQDFWEITNPSQNQWYTLSGLVTRTAGSTGSLIGIIHEYADTATSNGKVMEVRVVRLINLTQCYGAGNEPTEGTPPFNANFVNSQITPLGYWEGVKTIWDFYGITTIREDEIEYHSFSNLLTNSNFDDATVWTTGNATGSAEYNTYSLTGNGGGISAVMQQANSVFDEVGVNFYVCAKARVTNTDCTNLLLLVSGGAANTVSQATPTQNEWYSLCDVVTRANGASSSFFGLRHDYADAPTQNGKVGEFQQAIAININEIYTLGRSFYDWNPSAENISKLGYGTNYNVVMEKRVLSSVEEPGSLTITTYKTDSVIVNEEIT